MRVDYLNRKGRLYFEGNELLRYRIEIPCFLELDGYDQINVFYSEIASGCEAFCKEKLFPALCEKRTTKKYFYSARAKVTHLDEDTVCVVILAFLKAEGSKLFEFKYVNFWSVWDALPFTEKMILKKYARKSKKKYQTPFLKGGAVEELEFVDVEHGF